MKKRTLLMSALAALAITALVPMSSVAGEKAVWNGYLSGQLTGPMLTDYAVNEKTSPGSGGVFTWDGFLCGTAAFASNFADRCVLPAARSGNKSSWNGYLPGGFYVRET